MMLPPTPCLARRARRCRPAPAVEVQTLQHDAAEQGDELLGTQSLAMGGRAARVGRVVLVLVLLAQQGLQQGRASLLHGGARGLLQRFQVEGPRLATG